VSRQATAPSLTLKESLILRMAAQISAHERTKRYDVQVLARGVLERFLRQSTAVASPFQFRRHVRVQTRDPPRSFRIRKGRDVAAVVNLKSLLHLVVDHLRCVSHMPKHNPTGGMTIE
jgi:hypothetical protein